MKYSVDVYFVRFFCTVFCEKTAGNRRVQGD